MSLRPKRTLMCKLFCLISPSFRERVEATESVIVYLKIRANHPPASAGRKAREGSKP